MSFICLASHGGRQYPEINIVSVNQLRIVHWLDGVATCHTFEF